MAIWRSMRGRRRLWFCALALVAVLGGCGGSGRSGDSQVAARVNQQDITVHQVQAVLQQQPRLAADGSDAGSRRALDLLIEQELIVQAARSEGLDKDPSVVQLMQLAQRGALARAYQERVGARAVGPSSDEIDRYYDANPALFGQRRVYVLQELTVEASGDDQIKVRSLTQDVRDSKELEDRLRKAGLRYRSRSFSSAAEDLPLALVPPLSKLNEGQSLTLVTSGGVRVLAVVRAEPAPIDRRQAAPVIAGYLTGERKRELATETMKKLHGTAKIEYVGSFAKSASGAASTAAAVPAASR